MICYEYISGIYFEQDETILMEYFENLNDGDKILLRDLLLNLGVKQIPYIANKIDIIICKPLYRKAIHKDRNFEFIICFENCRVIHHI